MDNETIVYVLSALVLAASFIIGRYVLQKIPESTKKTIKDKVEESKDTIDFVYGWCRRFIIMEERFSKLSGTEKMDEVIKTVQNVLSDNKIEMTEDQIRAIAQEAYEILKGNYYLESKK